MDNQFQDLFASWPFRYYIIKDGKFVKIGVPKDSEFDMGELLDFLNH
jgi:hypothetical protein